MGAAECTMYEQLGGRGHADIGTRPTRRGDANCILAIVHSSVLNTDMYADFERDLRIHRREDVIESIRNVRERGRHTKRARHK